MKFTWSCRWMKKMSHYLKTLFSSHSNQGKWRIQGQGWEKTWRKGVFVSWQYYKLDSNSRSRAEPDLSRDRRLITTRWINTCVVKVKWCYVARCYWTRPVKIHDTDTFSRPLQPLLQAEALLWSPEKGQVLELSPTRLSVLTVKRAGCSSYHCLWHNQEDHLIPGGSFHVLVNVTQQNHEISTI